MQLETMKIEVQDEVAIITFTCPDKLNAISSRFAIELDRVLDHATEQHVGVVVFTGEGRAFCAGADIAEITLLDTVFKALDYNRMINNVFNRIEELPVPTVAAINGLALGGGLELAMTCDFRLASNNARLGLPEINIGVMPGAGGTQRLTRLVGLGKAKEMLYLAEPISASEAEKWGLVNKAVPAENLMETVNEMTEKLLVKPALALRMIKEAVNRAMELDLQSAVAYEGRLFALLFASEDKTEGLNSFLEKRKPRFRGK